MMKVPLITCVLLTFTSLGVSLDCEVCTGTGFHCNGITTTCRAEENTCVTVAAEIFGVRNVMKSCVPPSICSNGISTFHYSKIDFQRSVISCCAENGCNKNELKVPDRNTTVNGKTCPACYALQKDCVEEIIECVGDEVNCFEVSASASKDGVEASASMKGCANDAGCKGLKHGEALLDAFHSIGSFDVSHTVRCAGAALSSGISGSLFPSLSGLLLVRFLA